MLEKIKNISEAGDLKGKRVLLRSDFNVPIVNGEIADDFRIKKALPTLKFLKEQKAKIILASHIESKETDSLEPVFNYLKEIFPDIKFVKDYFPERPVELENIKEGEIVLLENLRKHREEKENDEGFAKHLASFAEVYINNAFPSSHRRHASIVGVSKFIPGLLGFLFQTEIENLSHSLHPKSPSLFVLGGAKFETKLPLLKKCLEIFDHIFVGGALANNFFKEKGLEIGESLVSGGDFEIKELLQSPKIVLPSDVVVKNSKGEVLNKKPEEVKKDERILDAGEESLRELEKLVKDSKFIFWNGPLGDYEHGFKESTLDLAKAISESSAESVVGGGDTFAAISSLDITDKFSFVSTGGGATLEFLANETLPGIEALELGVSPVRASDRFSGDVSDF